VVDVDILGFIDASLAENAERLLGEGEQPTGRRDRDAVGGEVEDQRDSILGTSRAKLAVARRGATLSCSNCLVR
jgi:hypothetical protein